MRKPTTRDMSDAHEAYVAELFGGYVHRGSGNQFNRPTDGILGDRYGVPFAFAFDGKSTFGDSIGVSKKMWAKVAEQAGAERPMLPLRFYDTERLAVGLDLGVVDLNDLAELVEAANKRAVLVKGLKKAVKDDTTEWVDANIVRMLLENDNGS